MTVGGTTETYGYAGDGVRLSAATGAAPGQTTQSGWDRVFGLPQLVLERDGAGTLQRSYRYGLDLLSQTAWATSYEYHADGLGSVADVTDSAGASLAWSEFYPYGVVRLAGSGAGAPAANPFGFTGEQRDGFTGLYHLRARQYDPGTGQFLTTDPLAALVSDPYVASYAYVRNSPTGWVDPSGLCGEEQKPTATSEKCERAQIGAGAMFVGLDSIALLQAYLAIGIPGSAGLATPGIAVAEAVLTAVDLFVIGAATFTILKGCVFGI